ncbi:MAG: hypothetical protein AB8B69_26165, partial [Chitinophagales bacterium]
RQLICHKFLANSPSISDTSLLTSDLLLKKSPMFQILSKTWGYIFQQLKIQTLTKQLYLGLYFKFELSKLFYCFTNFRFTTIPS